MNWAIDSLVQGMRMKFSNWSEFFQMGGYALYVWMAYGLTLVVLGTVIIALLLRHRRLQRDMARRKRRAQQSGVVK
jgi:heme exporter protein D